MVEEAKPNLTEEEKELYDRQIRLWGLEAQHRLRRSKVLIIGINGVGAEIVKNIVLSGVNSLTLMDTEVVSERDAFCQFLAPVEEIGQNRAVASFKRTHELNPHVEVTVETESLDAKEEDFVANYDIVVATGLSSSEVLDLDDLCSENNVKFIACDVVGLFGYMMENLMLHDYAQVIETLKPPPGSKRTGGTVDARAELESVNETVKNHVCHHPLEEVININWAQEDNAKKLKRLDPGYFVMLAILKFRDELKRNPVEESEADFEVLKSNAFEAAKSAQFPTEKISDELLWSCVSGITNPSCAIMGGVVAQEIIRALSQFDPPLSNIFIFDPVRNCGEVTCLPAA